MIAFVFFAVFYINLEHNRIKGRSGKQKQGVTYFPRDTVAVSIFRSKIGNDAIVGHRIVGVRLIVVVCHRDVNGVSVLYLVVRNKKIGKAFGGIAVNGNTQIPVAVGKRKLQDAAHIIQVSLPVEMLRYRIKRSELLKADRRLHRIFLNLFAPVENKR